MVTHLTLGWNIEAKTHMKNIWNNAWQTHEFPVPKMIRPTETWEHLAGPGWKFEPAELRKPLAIFMVFLKGLIKILFGKGVMYKNAIKGW